MTERIRLNEAESNTSLVFGDRKLTVYSGCVMDLATDALVCPVDRSLNVRTGLAQIIVDAAGSAPREERPQTREPFGKVIVLPGGDLKARYIFLSVLLGERGQDKIQSSIREAVDRSIRYAEFLRLKSVAFPLLGSAKDAPPFEAVARVMLEEVAQYMSKRKTRLKAILFSINNTQAYGAFRREARSLADR